MTWWKRAWVPVVAPLAVFASRLTGRRLIASGDAYAHYLPLHVLAARIWKSGHLPVWNPFSFSGYPLMATNQAAVFYPPNLLFLWLSPAVANNLVVVVNFVVAGLGAYLLARHLCRDAAGATVAGLAFGLCGFMFAHIGHQSMIASVSWLPWTMWGFELLRERLTPGRLLVAGGALAMASIAGHGQMFFLVLLVLGLYAAVLTALEWKRTQLRPLILAGVIAVVGAGLGAVQFLPTAVILGDTERSNLNYFEATTYSMPKSHVPLIAFPYLFGNPTPNGPFDQPYRGQWNLTELSGYPGAAVLVLAAAGIGAARRDRRVLALLAVATVAFVMALGGSTPFGHVVHHAPFYSRFRAWGRYLVAVDLCAALLAGYGVAALRERGRAPMVRALVALGGLGTIAFAVRFFGPTHRYMARGAPQLYALGLPLAAAAVAALLFVFGRRRPALAGAVLAVVVAADAVGSFGWFYEWRKASPSPAAMRQDFSRARPPDYGLVTDVPGGIDRWLYLSTNPGAVPQNVDISDVKGLRSGNGFDPLAPRDYQQAMGNMSYFGVIVKPEWVYHQDSRILDLLRVSVVLEDPPSTQGGPVPPGSRLGGSRPVPGTPLVRYEYAPRVPDAFIVGDVRRGGRLEILDHLNGTRPFDVSATAFVERRCARCASMRTPGPAGQVRRRRWTYNDVTVDVTGSRPGLLVLSQAWFPGWRASVDGRTAQVVRANGLVLSVPVDAGSHRVRLYYRAPGLRAGVGISSATLVILGAAVLATTRRRWLRPMRARAPAG